MPETLLTVFARQAAQHPDRLFTRFLSRGEVTAALTYSFRGLYAIEGQTVNGDGVFFFGLTTSGGYTVPKDYTTVSFSHALTLTN